MLRKDLQDSVQESPENDMPRQRGFRELALAAEDADLVERGPVGAGQGRSGRPRSNLDGVEIRLLDLGAQQAREGLRLDE